VRSICAERSLAFTPFSPLAGGAVTGKYERGVNPPSDSRMALRPDGVDELLTPAVFDAIDRLNDEAKRRHGVECGALALAWLLHHRQVTSVVTGPARRSPHLKLAAMASTAQHWAGFVGKVGAWPIALAGTVLMCVGFVWTLEIGHLNSVVVFGAAQVVIGTGYAMCYPATNITAVAGAQPEEQGLASGLFIAAFQIGSGVLLGVVASVFAGTGGDLKAYWWGIILAIAAATLAALICIFGVVRNRRPIGRQDPDDVTTSIVHDPACVHGPASGA
jgi:Aldo/keto reductase family/Major Facilitator Superfamily